MSRLEGDEVGFQISELGRVDVKLKLMSQGPSQAHL